MIINSSPLIVFGKLNKLDLLGKVLGKIIISEAVYVEVVERGSEKGAPEALLVKDYVEKGKIKVKKLNKRWKKEAVFLEQMHRYLDYGEAETICLALQEKENSVLMDEKHARKVASLYSLKPFGSLRVLLLAWRRNMIEEKEIETIISEMIQQGFRLGADVISEFWVVFKKLKK